MRVGELPGDLIGHHQGSFHLRKERSCPLEGFESSGDRRPGFLAGCRERFRLGRREQLTQYFLRFTHGLASLCDEDFEVDGFDLVFEQMLVDGVDEFALEFVAAFDGGNLVGGV